MSRKNITLCIENLRDITVKLSYSKSSSTFKCANVHLFKVNTHIHLILLVSKIIQMLSGYILKTKLTERGFEVFVCFDFGARLGQSGFEPQYVAVNTTVLDNMLWLCRINVILQVPSPPPKGTYTHTIERCAYIFTLVLNITSYSLSKLYLRVKTETI